MWKLGDEKNIAGAGAWLGVDALLDMLAFLSEGLDSSPSSIPASC